eukprot:5732982-Pyramimonas_sp.AAC.1
MQDCRGAAVTLIRSVDIPGMSRDWCFGTLPNLRMGVSQRGIVYSGNESLQEPMKRELGGRVYSNIVDESWVHTGPLPPFWGAAW